MYKSVYCDFNSISINTRCYWRIPQNDLEDGMLVLLVGEDESEPKALAKIHKGYDRKTPHKVWYEAEVIQWLDETLY